MKMFKVVESGDGLTRIVCRNTGKLICTVRGNGKVGVGCRIPRPANLVDPAPNPVNIESSLKPINVIEPSPKPCIREVVPISRDVKPRLLCKITPTIDHHVEPISSDNIEVPTSSTDFVSYPEVNEDYSDDCINQEEFMRCLGAIPRDKLKEDKIEKLNSEFPLRLISRTQPADASHLPDIKMCDEADLCSPLGSKLLNANHSRNYISGLIAIMCTKKYDSYCRVALSSIYLSGYNFPKLRCREVKRHPLTFRPQKTWNLDECHIYSFNRKQRLERIKTLRAGLNKRSRKLKILCNSKQLLVCIKRLSDNEIKSWAERKPPVVFMTNVINLCDSSDESDSPGMSITEIVPRSRTISESGFKDKVSSAVLDSSLQTASLIYAKKLTSKIDPSETDQNNCNVVSAYHSFSSKRNLLPLTPCSQYLNKLGQFHYVCFKKHGNFNTKCKKCTVKLRNILHLVVRVNEEYYVKGTNIKIMNFSLIADKLNCRNLKYNGKSKNICVSLPVFRLDHSYHRVLPKGPSNCNNNMEHIFPVFSRQLSVDKIEQQHNTNPNAFRSNNFKSRSTLTQDVLTNCQNRDHSTYTKSTTTVRTIEKKITTPIIDLTGDEVESQTNSLSAASVMKRKVPVVAERFFVSTWVFRCFGCGHKRVFCQKVTADDDVMDHMRYYHSVSQPDLFLSSYLDNVNHSVIIEAFPGYKTSFIEGSF